MNVSSVKNLNGETFSAVQDADLTTVVQTNSGEWDRISALSGYSANGYFVNITGVGGGKIIAGKLVMTASGVPPFTGYLTVSSYPNWVSISNGQIYLYNTNRSNSAQVIRPDNIVKWNNTTSVLQTNSSNWNDISAYQNASGTYLTAINISESADWEDTTDVVQTNSASWGAGSTPTYDYTDNNLISAIDTSGLYATSAYVARYANSVVNGGRLGADVYAVTGAGTDSMTLMILNPNTTPFGNTSGIYGPLYYAKGACMTYGSSAGNTQYFGGFFKGNEWYVSNTTAGQALRGETHAVRGVHLSGATERGTSFDLSIWGVSGKYNSANNYNWKLDVGGVSGKGGTYGEWRYGPAEDTALRTASAWNDTISTYQTASSTYLTAVDLTPYATTAEVDTLSSMLSGAIDYVSANAGDEFPVSADEAIQYVQTNSANIDDTVTSYQTNSGTYLTAHQAISAEEWNNCYDNVNTNSGAWGGSALPISAGPGIKVNLVDNTLVFSNDETVLWKGTLGAVGVTSATLSEAFTNFEQIEVWWAQQQERTLVQRYYTANLSQLFCVHGKFQASNGYFYLFIAAWSISGTSAIKKYCKYKSQDQWNNNTWTDANELCPCKIIGINRIAGGN